MLLGTKVIYTNQIYYLLAKNKWIVNNKKFYYQ